MQRPTYVITHTLSFAKKMIPVSAIAYTLNKPENLRTIIDPEVSRKRSTKKERGGAESFLRTENVTQTWHYVFCCMHYII